MKCEFCGRNSHKPISNNCGKTFFFLRKLFHFKTSLQLRNACHLNNVKILDFDQVDQLPIFMLKTTICRVYTLKREVFAAGITIK